MIDYRDVIKTTKFFGAPIRGMDIKCLHHYALSLSEDEIAVDFGTGQGKSAIAIGLSNPKIKVYTFEKGRSSGHKEQSMKWYYVAEITDRINQCNVHNVYFQMGDSLTIYPRWQYQIGLLNIDSDHTYETTKAELLRWEPFVRPRGYILLHDYHDDKLGIRQAEEELFGDSDKYQLLKPVGLTQPIQKLI